MKLLLKFNLIFLLVFVVGLAGAVAVARSMLRESAQAEVTDRARLLMEKANAVSAYTADQIKPLLETQMKYAFLPQSVPAYSATEVLLTLQKSYPDYGYKAAMLNPTNPRDRANAWEEDVVAQFAKRPEQTEFIGERETPGGRALYIARPIRISKPVCLTCHSTPAAAPATLIERYGNSNGFGWNLNDTLGAQIVTVPLSLPLRHADQQLQVVVGLLAALFVVMGAALNLMLWRLVIAPVTTLSALADRVSLGEEGVPEFSSRATDEIGVLTESFGRMRKSLEQAMKMLEG